MLSELTKSAMIEVLEDADRFACNALTAFTHKVKMFDMGSGRFKGNQNFMEAVTEIQSKIRIIVTRLKENN